jgi:hypothetical protein
MWRWRSEHILAWAIATALIVCPRAIWERIRLPAALAIDRFGERERGGAAGGEAADLLAVRAALIRTQAALAEDERLLAQVTALTRAVAGLGPERTLPVRVLGIEAAAAGSPARAGRVRLDAGRRSGVAVPATIVQGAALAGRVTGVAESASEAELVTAQTFWVKARNVRTGVEALVRGDGATGLKMRCESSTPDFREGDAVVTSDFSAIAPGNLAVGTVVGIETDRSTGVIEARLKPAADLSTLERALVILGEAPK